MASKDKPYRVYRGGRVKGPVRVPQKERRRGRQAGDGYRGTHEPPRKRRRWARRVGLVLLVLVLAALVWGVLGFLAFRQGVEEANARLDERAARALAPTRGSILTTPTNILLLGVDKGNEPGRSGPGRSDSVMLVRTDPDEHRIAYLSIPRDLRVTVPGHGTDKINIAYPIGGAALTIRTVESVTGLRIHHVALVDFASFGKLIDTLGGITVNVKQPILSNPFACPYREERCATWKGWRFRKGRQEMGGRRALIYSRIRQNQLDPNETDITRGERQQQVVQAIADEITSPWTLLRMPFVGDELVEPLATDLSAAQLLELGWVKFRAAESNTLRCKLGGTPASIEGADVLLATEENTAVVAMVTGETAPQPPPPGSGPFGPGCFVGRS